jgi:hypothetical protein
MGRRGLLAERMDDEVVDLSFGGSRAEPVVLLDPT